MDLILIKKLLKKHINKRYARILKKEKYYGNIEYKFKLCNIDEDKLHKLAAQMLFRLFDSLRAKSKLNKFAFFSINIIVEPILKCANS